MQQLVIAPARVLSILLPILKSLAKKITPDTLKTAAASGSSLIVLPNLEILPSPFYCKDLRPLVP